MSDELKNWVKKSGIKYSKIPPEHLKYSMLQGKEMIDSLNPFDHVIRIPEAPLATIHQNNLLDGISDTYHVLVGNHYDLKITGNGRIGVLDLLIFPLISRRLIDYAYNDKKNILFRVIAGVVGYPLETARGILGVGLTIILSPIVLLVHIALFIRELFLRNRFRHVNVKNYTVVGDEKLSETIASKKHPLKLIDIYNAYRTHYGSNFILRSLYRKNQPVISSDNTVCIQLQDHDERVTVSAHVEVNKDNREGLEAAIEEDFLDISRALDINNEFNEFRRKLN